MHDFIIHTRTQRRRKPVESLERRLGAVVITDERLGRPVELFRGHAGFDLRRDELQYSGNDLARNVNLLDFLDRLEADQMPIPA